MSSMAGANSAVNTRSDAKKNAAGGAFVVAMCGLLVLVIFGVLVSLMAGSQWLSVPEVASVLWGTQDASATSSVNEVIVWNLRVPRTILAMLVGSCLAVSGVMLQGIMRNPLAAPDIVGVTGGAGLAATIMIVLAPGLAAASYLGALALPIAAFIGAVVVGVVVFLLSWQPGTGTSPVRMILAGVAISAMIGGFQGFLIVYFSDRVQGVVLWLSGSLNTRSWQHVAIVLPCLLIGMSMAVALVRPLNILQLGENTAQSLGIAVNRTRVMALAAASLMTGGAVCTVGVVGFIGLVVPHLMRLTVGHTHGRLTPAAMLAGAVLVLWADIAARLLGEMPVGVLTAMIGGPYFVMLLYQRKLI